MNKEELSNLKVSELKEIAKEKQIDIAGLKKDEIIFKLTEKEEKKTENTYPVEGILTILEDGFGFIRNDNFSNDEENVYVSPTFIKKFRLRQGDYISGKKRDPKDNERYYSLIYIDKINYQTTDMIRNRVAFEDLTPIFPNERVKLERQGESLAMRVVDLMAPIGKGQRGLIVSPPKAGKTTILKDMALSILRSCPKSHLIILLIDERPEEVTDIK